MNLEAVSNNRGSSAGKVVGIIFLIGAALLIALALFLFFGEKPPVEEIDAEITDIEGDTHTVRRNGTSYTEEDHEVYVDYTYDGEEYTNVRCNYYISTMEEGDIITITVDPETGNIRAGAVAYYIIGAVVSFFALIGAFLGILMIKLDSKSH